MIPGQLALLFAFLLVSLPVRAVTLEDDLIGRYGVSGAEGPVREEIARQLPSWAKPETDAKATSSSPWDRETSTSSGSSLRL